MIRGVGASKTGLEVEQRRTEVLANNLANINTAGFKKSVAVSTEFESMLLQRIGDPTDSKPPTIGSLGNGAAVDQVLPLEVQGEIVATGRLLDFAIEGPGQFVTEGPNGLVYTRNGAFRESADGTLVSAEGNPVVIRNQDGALTTLKVSGADLTVRDDGTLLIGNKVAGRLEVEGSAKDTRIRSQVLEASNVELAKEMSDLIVSLRSFQVNQRALQMQDQTLGRAVSEIGKV